MVDVIQPLQCGQRPFHAHTGIHIMLSEAPVCAIQRFIVFHKDVVPNFKPFSTGAARTAAGVAGFAGVEEDFRIGTARAGYPSGSPPVFLLGQEENPILGQPQFSPQPGGKLIARGVRITGEDGDCQAAYRDGQFTGEKFMAPGERFCSEVIAQRPVPKHFKKGEVRGITDLIDIIGANALLKIGKAFAHGMRLAEQIGDQRVHPGCGEKHRRIIFREERSRWNAFMPSLFKKV